MNVPLSASVSISKGIQKLIIWTNGERKVVNCPFPPYFYSFKNINTPSISSDRVDGIRLSDYGKTVFTKHSFQNNGEVERFRIPGTTYEHNIPYLYRVRADIPDFYTRFPHTDELRFLFFDIEQWSEPGTFFPTFDDRITNIAYATNKNRKVQKLYIDKSTKTDRGMLDYFSEFVTDFAPDVYVYYNKSYDLPTMIRRFEKNSLDTKAFCRGLSKPRIYSKKEIKLEGSIIYDPWETIRGDQALNGEVPDRGLKAVSDYFGFKTNVPVVDFRTEQMCDLVGTPRLRDYNEDDVKRLMYVFDIYYDNVQMTAEQLQIPLSESAGLNVFDLGITLLGEEFHKRGIISDGSNADRFPEIFKRKKLKKDEPNFQGALIGIKRFGTFVPVAKADASSMYPTIMSLFNFSHDTCFIVDYLPYIKDGFRVKDEGDYFLYYVPDNILSKTVLIKVLKRQGLTTKIMLDRISARAEYKAKYKKTKIKKFKSLSDIEKVKANGIYGCQGSGSHPFGHLPIAIATVGVAREAIKILILTLEELYPGCVIEWDTDGVYFEQQDMFDEVEVWRKFDEHIEEKFGRELVIDLGYDYYDSGYFRKAKNYVLKRGNVLELHGVSMKSMKMCPLEKALVNELCLAKLGEGDENLLRIKYDNLGAFKSEDFIMSVEQGMPLDKYASQSVLPYRLAVQAQHVLNQTPEIGNKYYYLKTTSGYELYQVPDRSPIDYKYYMKKVKDVFARFSTDAKQFKSLDTFFGTPPPEGGSGEEDWDFSEEDVQNLKKKKGVGGVVGLDNFF